MPNASTAYGDPARPNAPAFARSGAAVKGVSRNRKILLFLLLLVASAEFVARGPVRFVKRAGRYNDFTPSYVGAKAWVQGLNPYSPEVFDRIWSPSATPAGGEPRSVVSRNPYPWTCFLIFAPLSLFSPYVASLFVGVISTGAILLSLWLVSGLPELQHDPWRRWLFLGLAIGLAPFHSGLGQANISMLAIPCIFLSFWAASTRRPVWAGVFCAISACLKPPLGAFFAIFYLFTRQWKALGTTVAGTLLLAGVAASRLQLAGVPWFTSYLNENKRLVAGDPLDSFTAVNPNRFEMVNLQVLWYAITKNERLASEFAFGITLLLLLVLAVIMLRRHDRTPSSLDAIAFAAICLLPVYHRFYDAALLALPLYWALSTTSPNANPYRKVALLLLVPFAVPGAWALESLQNAGRIPEFLTDRWWWEPVALAHQIWAVLLLALVLVAANWQLSRPERRGACPAVQGGKLA